MVGYILAKIGKTEDPLLGFFCYVTLELFPQSLTLPLPEKTIKNQTPAEKIRQA
jgi:hypothetical protein